MIKNYAKIEITLSSIPQYKKIFPILYMNNADFAQIISLALNTAKEELERAHIYPISIKDFSYKIIPVSKESFYKKGAVIS